MKTNYSFSKAYWLIALIVLLVTELTIAQDWYNTSWQYRRPVTVPNSGSALTDFQVKIALNTSNFDFTGANSNGSDIRITGPDGTTSYSFWIEEWVANISATIWLKVPSLPTGGTTVYLYYGNNAAVSASSGTATFKFFDDFTNGDVTFGKWIRILNYPWGTAGYTTHDWKYSMEMQQGALYYSINKAQNGWNIESLDTQIQQEFDYMHSQINANGTITGMGGEPQYCYGVALSNLALGYLYYKVSNPTLALSCYNDMVLVYGYVKSQWQNTIGLADAGGSSMALCGFSNAWKAFTDYGNTVSAAEVFIIVQNYANTFISNQPGGSWTGATGIQEHEKRDFGVLLAYDVTGNFAYLTAVKNNIDYILATFWVSSNGGLKWYGSTSDPFYECHQQWFMIAVRMLYNKSGGAYDYLAQGLQAWHFLTDNNYSGIDLYVHNYVNNGAFFSYRNLSSGGSYNLDGWKGSYEIGTALWGMSLNYDWLSNYHSSHSSQAYNYLNEMVIQIKKSPVNKGYFDTSISPSSTLWSKVGNPTASIVQDNNNNVLSSIGPNSHAVYIASIDKSFNNFILEAKVKMLFDVNNACTPEISFRYTNDNNKYFTMLRGESQNDVFLRKYYGGAAYINATASYNFTANQYYKYKLSANGNAIGLYLNEVLVLNPTNAGGDILTGGITLGNYGNGSNPVYYDDVRIRSYVSVDPLTTVGTKQFLSSQWTGAIDTDWSNANNWSNTSVPQSYSFIVIPSAPSNQPHITSASTVPAFCKNLTIDAGAVVTIDPGKALTVSGILTNNNGSSGLVIKSNNMGAIGSLLYSGNVLATVEQYLSKDTYHMVASPISNGTISSFMWMYLYAYYEPTNYWETLSNPISLPLNVGEGYFVWPYSYHPSVPPSPDYAIFNGNLNYQDINLILSNTDASVKSGWNLYGNPFPSALNWNMDPSWNRINVTPSMYIKDPVSGNYAVWNAFTGVGTNPNGGYIAPTQAFWVRASDTTGAAASLTIPQSQRAHNGASFLKNSYDILSKQLLLEVTGSNGSDKTIIGFADQTTSGFDSDYDAIYLDGEVNAPSLYSMILGNRYAINQLPSVDDYNSVPVNFESKESGSYHLVAYWVESFEQEIPIYFEDRKEGIFQDLRINPEYVFISDPSDNPDRFIIHFAKPNDVSEDRFNPITIYTNDESIYIQLTEAKPAEIYIYDITGREIIKQKSTSKDLIKIKMTSGSGYYLVKVSTGDQLETGKIFLK